MGRKAGPSTPTAPVPSHPAIQGHSSSAAKRTEHEDKQIYMPPSQPKLFLSRPFVDAALVKGSLKTLVSLPRYLDVMEWVAMNKPPDLSMLGLVPVFDFYNNINLFYGAIAERCTSKNCPTMTAGDKLVYTWVDANNKQVKLPAATYIDFVFTWVQNLLEDPSIFPTKAGHPFPANFPAT
ncbi:16637_t:CDS:2, partial [Acaulospora colombiana]